MIPPTVVALLLRVVAGARGGDVRFRAVALEVADLATDVAGLLAHIGGVPLLGAVTLQVTHLAADVARLVCAGSAHS